MPTPIFLRTKSSSSPYWVEKLDSSGIKRGQITGPTGSINGSFYILPSDQQIADSVKDFFTPPTPAQATTNAGSSGSSSSAGTVAALTPTDLSGITLDVVNATGRAGQAAMAGIWLDRQGASLEGVSNADAVVNGPAAVKYSGSRGDDAQKVAQALGIQQVEKSPGVSGITVVLGDAYTFDGAKLSGTSASALRLSSWQALQKQAGITLMAPSYVPSDFSYSFDRSYDLNTGNGTKPAVRVGYRYNTEDLYAGVSASSWTGAPLAGPGVKVQVGDVTYTVVGAVNKPDHVWWVKDGLLYWVSQHHLRGHEPRGDAGDGRFLRPGHRGAVISGR